MFIEGLIDNLQVLLDKYILSGSPKKVRRAVLVRVLGRYQNDPWTWKSFFGCADGEEKTCCFFFLA